MVFTSRNSSCARKPSCLPTAPSPARVSRHAARCVRRRTSSSVMSTRSAINAISTASRCSSTGTPAASSATAFLVRGRPASSRAGGRWAFVPAPAASASSRPTSSVAKAAPSRPRVARTSAAACSTIGSTSLHAAAVAPSLCTDKTSGCRTTKARSTSPLSLSVFLSSFAAATKELKKTLKLKGEVDLAFVVRQPDVLSVQSDGATAAAWSDVEPIVEQAAAEVRATRGREGAALATELVGRLEALAAGAGTNAQRPPARLEAGRPRTKKAVAELAAGVPVDEQRLAVEIALMADRVDITQDLVRLRTHLTACRETLARDGAVGKQLGFLAQELLREVNTIGSKANDAAITQTVIAMKGELEKFREQLENLE